MEERALGGKGIFFKKLSTKPSQTHWYPSVLHLGSKLKPLNPENRPTALSPWAESSLLDKALYLQGSLFTCKFYIGNPHVCGPSQTERVHKFLGVAYSIFSLQFIGKLILMHSNYIMKCNVKIFHESYLNRV